MESIYKYGMFTGEYTAINIYTGVALSALVFDGLAAISLPFLQIPDWIHYSKHHNE